MHLKRYLLIAAISTTLWAQIPAADPQKVVASVGGKDVTAADVMKMLLALDAQAAQAFQRNPQDILGRYYLIVQLANEAEKAKLLEKSPYKEQFEGLRLQLLGNARVNEENNTFPVTPEMIESYYKEHGTQYEQAKIKVIYISFSGQAAVTGTGVDALQAAAKSALKSAQAKHSEAEARTLSEDIVKQLRGGADFVKLVQQYSEDAASQAAGGDFGIIKAVSEYPTELKNAVFALQPGEISEPLRQPNAFYIIRLEEKGPQPLNEVREPIIQFLRNDHMNQWMKDLNASHQAAIKDPDFFKSLGPATAPNAVPAAPPRQ